jgi:pyruvate dehydrogenase E2 component (dihydrolipoamide acetyltransferase)
MSTEVTMPTLGLTMEEGTVTEWLKQEGDSVAKDEPLFVVETDKASMEVPSPTGGVLQKIIAEVGATVPVRQAVAVIGETAGDGGRRAEGGERTAEAEAPAETEVTQAVQPMQPAAAQPAAVSAPTQSPSALRPPPSAQAPPSAVRPPPSAAGERVRVSPRARRVAGELQVDLHNLRGSGPEGRIIERDIRAAAEAGQAEPAERVVASPLARKLAAEHGIELTSLQGSGPAGRIVEKDVMAAVEAAPAEAPAAAPRPPAPAPPIQLGRLRRLTAERMAASAQAVARVTLFMTIDMSEAVRFRTQLAPEFERRYGARLGYDAMIAKAVGLALRDHPELNAQWADGAVRPMPEVNVGTAVALDEGLLVVVVRQADVRPLHQVQSELIELVEKARANRLSPDDMSGSTFTITNLGNYGVEAFTPIVNLPEAAILGVGRIAREPAVVDDELAIREQMALSLAFDHRVADGAPAARFLQRVKDILEAPYILLT